MPSIMQRVGTPNPRHNLEKKYRSHLENVDPELSRYNKVISRRSVEEIYAQHLQPAFEEFNNRQKRKDRRLDVKWGVDSALEYQRALDKKARASQNSIDRKGKPPIREIIWQIGNPSQGYGCAGQTEESRQEIFNMLQECQEEARDRYKQLLWGDEVIHADEVSKDAEDQDHGSIHLHASFVPVCYQNKQGPDVQVAFERCLREMGFESFNAWKQDLDQLMEDVLQRHGLTRTVMDNQEKHQTYTEYHRQQQEIARTKQMAIEKADMEKRLIAINSIIGQASDNIGRSIEEHIQGVIEEVLADPAHVYEDAMYFIYHCSNEQLAEISRQGRRLKRETLPERVADTGKIKKSLEQIIADAAAGRIVTKPLTWMERQELWEKYNEASAQFWSMRADLKECYRKDLDKAYSKSRDIHRSYYDALYFLDRCHGLLAILIAVVWLIIEDIRREKINDQIKKLKVEHAMLVRYTASFTRYSQEYRQELKKGKFPGENCMEQMARVIRELDIEYQRYRIQIQEQGKNRHRMDWDR